MKLQNPLEDEPFLTEHCCCDGAVFNIRPLEIIQGKKFHHCRAKKKAKISSIGLLFNIVLCRK